MRAWEFQEDDSVQGVNQRWQLGGVTPVSTWYSCRHQSQSQLCSALTQPPGHPHPALTVATHQSGLAGDTWLSPSLRVVTLER